MEKAGAFFGIVPRLVRGVCDLAGVLRDSDTRRIRRSVAAFEGKFPQCGFTAAFMALGRETPAAAYAFWVFNRTNLAGELNQGSRNRHFLLLVDVAGGSAWMTLGYGLEPFISRKSIEGCLEASQPHFAAGQWGLGVSTLLSGIETVIRDTLSELPKVFGLPGRIGNQKNLTGVAVTAP